MVNKDREIKNKTNLAYYYRNRERILEKFRETSKEYYAEHREAIQERANRSKERNYENILLGSARHRAARTDLAFSLVVEDIVIPEVCPLLEIPLTRLQGQGRVWSNASIDRIDSTKGYTKENIQILSLKANVMKSHATEEELIIFAKNCLKLLVK